MKTRVVLAVISLLAVVFLAYPARADVWNKNWNVSANPQVRVNADAGNIRVDASNFTQAKAVLRTVGWRIAEDEVRVLEKQVGNSLEIEVKVPSRQMDWLTHREITLELTVPRGTELDLRTGHGNITTRGLEAALRADTDDGNLTTTGAKGTIRLHTRDGNIIAEELDGSLTADTGDGNLRVQGRFDVLQVQTGDGNVEVTASVGSRLSAPWKLWTGDGNIDLWLPEGVSADLDATTGDGRVTVDFPVKTTEKVERTAVRGPMNGGGQQLQIHTGDGNIKLEKR
jgi:DUF4097 and DUF4098 domain-containing protein YvlB